MLIPRKKRIVYFFLVSFLAFLVFLLVPAASETVFADEEEYINGWIPNEKEFRETPKLRSEKLRQAPADLPVRYRSDEQPWAAGVRVKDQDKTSLCWAFSVTTAAEYSYAKELYEENGIISEISPGHLGYFYFNRVNDPLGLTEDDFNKEYSKGGWATDGGNQLYALQHLATWSGMGLESSTPFSSINDHVHGSVWDGMIPYEDKFAYEDYATLEESTYLLGADTNSIKQLVLDYGAVSAAVYFDTKNYFNTEEDGGKYKNGRSFFNFDESESLNHAVTIIGWDDTYPKENFTHEKDSKGKPLKNYSAETARQLTTPKENGAWIVQNSWGTEYHENGIFYVSYESLDINADDSDFYACNMQSADTYQYNFQYDGTADCGDSSDSGNENFYTAEGTSAANVYTNSLETPVKLEAVGFTTFNHGPGEYKIDVYKNLKDPKDPTSGQHAGTSFYSTGCAGVKTAKLEKAVGIGSGETFSIVFTFYADNAFGVEKARYSRYQVDVNPGQSFFRAVGSEEWKDVYEYGACYRIKAFANEAVPLESCTVSDIPDQTFTGKAITPQITVKDGDRILQEGTDFSVMFSNNTDVGEAAATLVGMGDYVGTVTKTFLVDPAKISSAGLSYTSKAYTGFRLKPAVTVYAVLDGKKVTLSEGEGYSVVYQNNLNAGEATVIITGRGNFTGTLTKKFKITRVNLSSAALEYTTKVYTGKAFKPQAKVRAKVNGKTAVLAISSDYSLSYKNNVNAGTATVTIKGKGNFKGTLTKNFSITKANNKIAKFTPQEKTLKYRNLQKGAQSFKISATDKFGGTKVYSLSSVSKNRKFFQVSSAGKVTVRQGVPKGTYKLKVKIVVKGTKNYYRLEATKQIMITVR